MYKIGEFAKLAGVSIATLRRYHNEGKFVAFALPSGHRVYTDAHLEAWKTGNFSKFSSENTQSNN